MTRARVAIAAIAAAVAFAAACDRGAPSAPRPPRERVPDDAGADPTEDAALPGVAAPDATAERAPASRAASPAEDAGAARPVVVRSFRRSDAYGKADAVGPRSRTADGEKDAVFELVVEGDVTHVVVWSAASSTAAQTKVEADVTPLPPAFLPDGGPRPVALPPLQKTLRAWAMLQHVPDLFVFEADAPAQDLRGVLLAPAALPSSLPKRRTLRLHTWKPDDARGPWRVRVLGRGGDAREAASP
jgi:hypothetical protein